MKTGEALEEKLAGSGNAQEAAQFLFTPPLAAPGPVFIHASFRHGCLDSPG